MLVDNHRDLVSKLSEDDVGKVTILTDCTSCVSYLVHPVAALKLLDI